MPVGDYGMKKIEIISENQSKFERAFSTPFSHNWTWNFWTGFDILFGSAGSIIMGILGIVANAKSWRDSWSIDVEITPKQYLTARLLDNPTLLETYLSQFLPKLVQQPVFQEVVLRLESELIGIGDAVSFMTSCFFFALGIIDVMMNVYGFKLIFKIVLAIVSIYLPDMVTGFMMVWDGFFNLVDTKADIGWIWSNYKIIYVS